MSCDTGLALNKGGEMVATNMNFFQNYRLKKSKRYRSAFTTEQINYLENEFKKFPYIGNTNRKEVANILDISERAVKIWFQNRRMKEKREVNGNKESHSENKNNIYNFSRDLLNNTNMQTNNDFGFKETLLSNQRDKSKESTIKNLKVHYNLNEKHVLTNQIKIKNNKMSNNKHNRTKDNRHSDILKSVTPPRIKCETTTLLAEPQKIIKTAHLNDGFTKQERNAIPCHNKKESEVAQDLTTSNRNMKDHQQFDLVNSNIDQRFTPFYTQGYYAPTQLTATTFNPGNIIWKPVNVMPMPMPGLAACSPFSVTHNSSNNQDGTCNCHGPPHWLNTRPQCVASTQPQYIFAFPFSNSANKI
ncbi:homeobox protein 10-like [Vanessa cardui]|uniref:homeobox protein 10-like n=1 Tax=Vanessa cardui TaxID=171605 RepID=UPI001F12B784|nr:homeobox protein 10-like [Vanessa cardui]